AFAVLYEGKPGQTVSGGRMAAPMVRNFFEPLKKEIKEIIAPPKKALVVVEEEEPIAEDEEGETEYMEDNAEVLKAIPLEETDLDNPERAIPLQEDEEVSEGLEEE
ncbi:MAG: hypothetical protein H7Y36_00880, partial [Armatimonadetes bacterium]|nr:hypothetical protein [Akkermansiaceae bacterium]